MAMNHEQQRNDKEVQKTEFRGTALLRNTKDVIEK
jgi:hypothetical protein